MPYFYPMKKSLLLLPLLALAIPAAAQTTELIGRAGLGLMHFGGPDALAVSAVNYGGGFSYTNSPYGSLNGAGLSVGGRVQRVSSWGGLLAFDVGYDWLRTRTRIATVNYYDGSSNTPRSATGTTALQSQAVTGFLGLGYRLTACAVQLDLLAGPELAYVARFRETGSGTYDGSTAWETDRRDRAPSRVDARLRADFTAWYHRVGFNASYSHGFSNYQGGLVGGSPEVYARILRLGLAYRLR